MSIEMIRRNICPNAIIKEEVIQSVEEERRKLSDDDMLLIGQAAINNMIQSRRDRLVKIAAQPDVMACIQPLEQLIQYVAGRRLPICPGNSNEMEVASPSLILQKLTNEIEL